MTISHVYLLKGNDNFSDSSTIRDDKSQLVYDFYFRDICMINLIESRRVSIIQKS